MTKIENKLLGYALHFTSFMIENEIEPRRVILFGSVARKMADKESDVDLFVDVDESDTKKVMATLKVFIQTFGETWSLKGVSNTLSIVIGNLDSRKWEDLKRSMQSCGIVLYAKFTEQPKDIRPYLIFRLNFVKLLRHDRISIWRMLYGYSQKIGKKVYRKRGLVADLGGKKLEKSVVVVPSEKSKDFKEFLIKHDVGFSVSEIWSDSI